MKQLRLSLDGKNRVTLTDLLPKYNVSSLRAWKDGTKIVLEPMAEIPADQLWLFENPKAFKSVMKGLQEVDEGKIESLEMDYSEFKDEEI